uniref:Uncharacterized protein n=1 Tax=viral metagenome TaxID=1070528 RepID=A0A6M3LTL0_9ZZZZ
MKRWKIEKYHDMHGIFITGDRGICVVQTETETPTEEEKAHAALIAAAPELLDFAIQVKYSLGGGCDPGKYAAPYTNEELIDMASRLIEAAEGVQNDEG